MALPAGTRLGPYEIQAALGAGGMGEVYRARDTRLDRTVAIKVLPSEFSRHAELRKRLEREARTLSSLAHPHICSLYDVGQQNGVDFLVMEYLEGETLARRLLKGTLPAGQVLQCGIEIADALVRAHRHGIIHRDLKPGNIMLTKDGAKLLDFGLARVEAPVALLNETVTHLEIQDQKLTEKGVLLGTFQYMAPEQLEGKEADARTDIFALGTVIYEMATGKTAFSGKNRTSLITAILASEPPAMMSLQPLTPPALERVVKICLAKDPDTRWQSAQDLKLQLQWIMEGGSQAGLPAPVAARRRSREKIAWALVALLTVVSVALGVGFFQRTPELRTVETPIAGIGTP
jgi:eukaryotic-like serine/threonine-protein kinase